MRISELVNSCPISELHMRASGMDLDIQALVLMQGEGALQVQGNRKPYPDKATGADGNSRAKVSSCPIIFARDFPAS